MDGNTAVPEVEPSRTIDPGLIRINIAYGFMRAYDILSQQSSNPNVQSALITLSDQIAGTRKQIWIVENAAWNDMGSYLSARDAQGNEVGDPGPFINDMASLRALKTVLWVWSNAD
jgi:hypothetical protein